MNKKILIRKDGIKTVLRHISNNNNNYAEPRISPWESN